jgi:pimeloyl-ACP methyl ester carboxylesterase
MAIKIDREFVRISEGQVHVRRVQGAEGRRPLCMIHLSPLSSKSLIPLMTSLCEVGFDAPLVAPDTLGNGESAPPTPPEPDIAYFADSLARVLDALGVDSIDLFGMHTGARTACEFALAHPGRVHRLVLDGITEYPPETRALFKERYTPKFEPDAFGTHFIKAFNCFRNQFLYFPWFLEDAAHSLNKTMPEPRVLHELTMEVLNSLDTYQLAYNAAFNYPSDSKVPALKCKTLLLKPHDGTPSITAVADKYANGDNITAQFVPDEKNGMARAIREFLETT